MSWRPERDLNPWTLLRESSDFCAGLQFDAVSSVVLLSSNVLLSSLTPYGLTWLPGLYYEWRLCRDLNPGRQLDRLTFFQAILHRLRSSTRTLSNIYPIVNADEDSLISTTAIYSLGYILPENFPGPRASWDLCPFVSVKRPHRSQPLFKPNGVRRIRTSNLLVSPSFWSQLRFHYATTPFLLSMIKNDP